MTRAELKIKSKEQIQGHIPKLFLCILASSVLLSLNFFTTVMQNLNSHLGSMGLTNFIPKYNYGFTSNITISIVVSIILSIIYPAIEYSLSKIFLYVVRKKEFTIKDFFKNIFDLSIIKKTFCLSILQNVYVLLPSLLFILLEFIIITFILSSMAPMGTSGLVILLFGIPIFAITIYVFSIPYSMSYYILIDKPDMKSKEVLKESKCIMRGHKLSYVILQLSFIGWLLLNAITLGLVTIYLEPYYKATITNFYEHIKHKDSQANIIQ